MSTLYPTPTRVALLRALIAGDRIYQSTRDGDLRPVSWHGAQQVTARMGQMATAGWVILADPDPDHPWRRLWQVTDAGAKVVAADDARRATAARRGGPPTRRHL